MKVFKRTYLPESIKYNNEVFWYNGHISGSMKASNTRPNKVIEALKTTGKKGIVLEVLSSRLKGKTDLRGNYYRPTVHIFTNQKTY
ncbi:MAG: hypothetical protein ACJARG_000050 [Arcticibacterium sp.]|jgi:hypothetical protein